MNITAMTLVGCLILASVAYSASPDAKSPTTAADKADLAKLAEGCNAFAADLYAQLASKPGLNLFFSPASIDTALAMTYAGAAGQTADQMAKTLHFTLPGDKLHPAFAKLIGDLNNPATYKDYEFPEMGSGEPKLVEKPAYQLSVANALWGQQGYDFKQSFLGLLHETYKAGLNPVDFRQPEAARKTINDWVAKETKDKIQDLIPAGLPSPDTRLVLTNAIYFKSKWAETFSSGLTKEGPFKLSAGKTIDVPMMHKKHGFGYCETEDVQILSLPYKADQLDMVVLLPTKANGLADMEKSLGSKLGAWLKAIKPEQVVVTLPKFKFTNEFKLSDTLKAMGMTDAFDSAKASFTGITTKEPVFISEVLHKAFVAVDEEGTEAAAATVGFAVGSASFGPPPKLRIFTADHPFIFLIRHNPTNTVLFMGRLAEPKG